MIDLHTHSTASDGSLAPAALVAEAAAKGVSVLALTDHDTISGLEEGAASARKHGIRFIRGVEIEIKWHPGEFHLLGLDLGDVTPELSRALDSLAATRLERNLAIVQGLRDDGYDISMDDVRAVTSSVMLGRPHIADALIMKKIVRTRQQAFLKFLAKGRQYYQPKACIELTDAIRMIKESGGLAIVAHPLSLFVSFGHLQDEFARWKELGIDGIEAWHPAAKKGQCERLELLGNRFSFRVTAGSDYHGDPRADRRLGHSAGKIKIDDRYLASLER